jgi:hypothetical protein
MPVEASVEVRVAAKSGVHCRANAFSTRASSVASSVTGPLTVPAAVSRAPPLCACAYDSMTHRMFAVVVAQSVCSCQSSFGKLVSHDRAIEGGTRMKLLLDGSITYANTDGEAGGRGRGGGSRMHGCHYYCGGCSCACECGGVCVCAYKKRVTRSIAVSTPTPQVVVVSDSRCPVRVPETMGREVAAVSSVPTGVKGERGERHATCMCMIT